MNAAARDLWRAEYPFDSRYLDIDGHRMHYVDEGSGPALVLVHGNPTWSFLWRHLISSLSDRYRLVAIDHLGMGLSDKPQRYPYSMSQHAENLSALLAKLEIENATLVGHDWGGAIGLQALTTTPERFRRIILFNTGAFPPPRVPRRIAVCRFPFLGRLAVRSANLFARAALRMASAHPRKMTPAARGGLLAPYGNWRSRVGIWRFIQDIPLSSKHPTHFLLEQLEKNLIDLPAYPVALIWGMQDWCFDGECLRRMETIFPQAQSHRLLQAGHWVTEDEPDQVTRLVTNFLHETRDIHVAPWSRQPALRS